MRRRYMRFNFDYLGWSTIINGERVLVTPMFTLASNYYPLIIIADVATKEEARELADEIATPKQPKRSKDG